MIGLSPVFLLGGFLLYDEIGERQAPQHAGSAVISPEAAGADEQAGKQAADASKVETDTVARATPAETLPVAQASFRPADSGAARLSPEPADGEVEVTGARDDHTREHDGWRVVPEQDAPAEDDFAGAVVPQPRWAEERLAVEAATVASSVPLPRARPGHRLPISAGVEVRETVLQVPASAPRAPLDAEAGDALSRALREADKPPVPMEPLRERLSAVDGAVPVGDARVVIHHNAGPGEARQLREVLGARGLSGAEIRRVGVTVSQANVRYFHPQDREAASEVNRVLRDRGYSSELRSFTDFAPQPARGTVEVWLPG